MLCLFGYTFDIISKRVRLKLLVSALEHSANIHLKALKQEFLGDVEMIGIFDKKLGKPYVDLSSLAIMGFVDVIKKVRFFINLNRQMASLAGEADKVLLIDSSGFNLPLAKKIKKMYPNKEIIYYILPQAWAWKQKRIEVLQQTITHLASILPFEKEYYSQNAPISYVGHPLLDEIKEFKQTTCTNNQVVFMPGSREGEIKKLMPIFKQVKEDIHKTAVLIVPEHFTKAKIDKLYGDTSGFIVTSDVHHTLATSDFAFICSGTATLEAALIGIPFALVYVAKTVDYFLASRLVKLDYIGLANIMFEKFKHRPMHKEFIQKDVTKQNLLDVFHSIDKDLFMQDSKALREYLKFGSSKTVARMIEC